MAVTFNADEIFEMAEQIERNGAAFYREAADKSADEKMKDMLLSLASMEDTHLEIFKEMRQQLGPREKEQLTYDPDNQAMLYLQVIADGHGFEGKKSPTDKLTGNESKREILEIAVEAEKNSVVFYTGLKELISVNAGRDKVENIIREELGHLALLKTYLASE